MLEFNIRNQEISRIDNFSPAEKSVEYLIAKFNFKTEDWNGAVKRAIFRNVKSKVEKDAMLEDDTCIVPWEVLVGSSDIEVSVHGVIGTEEITTDVVVFNLNRTLSGGSASQEPSPTVYEQMLKEMQETKNIAKSVRDDADAGKFNGKDGESGTGKIDEEQLLQFAIKQTTEKAEFLNIQDSVKYKVLDFGMEGITKQDSIPGNQLFDISKFETAYTNINNGDGTVTVTSYAPSVYNSIKKVCPTVKVGQTIIFSGKNLNRIYFGNTVQAANVSFIVTQEMLDTDRFAFYGNSDSSADNPLTISDIMLNEGTTSLPCESYTGNKSSPNPDYKQEIKNAGVYNEETGRYEIGCRVGNKNLFDVDDFKSKELVSFYSTYNGYKLNTVPGQTYTFNRKNSDGYNVEGLNNVRIIDGTGKTLAILIDKWTSSYNKSSVSFVAAEDTYFAFSSYMSNVLLYFDTYFINPQLELGSTATDYTEHQSTEFTLTSDRPLTMWDKLVKRDGVWGWSVNHEKFNPKGHGINSVCYRDKTSGVCVFSVPNAVATQVVDSGVKCNRAIVGNVTEGNVGKFRIYNNALQIRLLYPDGVTQDTNNIDAISAFKEMFNNVEYIFEYQTAEEQAFIPLPDEEQTLLNNLETYYGVTNVYNDQGCPMWIKYVADTKLYVDKKLLEIQSAMI